MFDIRFGPNSVTEEESQKDVWPQDLGQGRVLTSVLLNIGKITFTFFWGPRSQILVSWIARPSGHSSDIQGVAVTLPGSRPNSRLQTSLFSETMSTVAGGKQLI